MIRAVIADDSNLFRKILTQILEKDGRVEVVGTAVDGEQAVELVRALNPDILILDYLMPVMDGFEALSIIMNTHPLPVLMLSALTREGAALTVRALELGAVDYFSKPDRQEKALSSVAEELIEKIIAIVGNSSVERETRSSVQRFPGSQDKDAISHLRRRPVDIIAVGSSTGGVQAAIRLLTDLPANTKPVVWVQHMPENFTASFAERLNQQSKLTVKEAESGDLLQPNCCYIAKAGLQMKVVRHENISRIHLYKENDTRTLHTPSCDVLFESVAELYGSRAVGVILTGMGDDGKKGLCAMHAQGAFVIGQNAQSSVVYGMAKAAFQAGLVDLELDMAQISEALVKLGAAG